MLLGIEIIYLRNNLVFLYQNQYLINMLLKYRIEGYIPITISMAEPIVPNGTDINITEY
jgi:hypothetical protein